MSQAPSEKHLEDYLWAHPEAFGEYSIADGTVCDPAPHLIPKWRQVPIASGIVDLVGTYFDSGLAIVEIKKGPVDSKAFAQLMRYKRDFKQMVHYLIHTYQQERLPNWELLNELPYPGFDWNETLLRGVLVGSSVMDNNLLIACDACDVDVFTYQYENGEYTLAEQAKPDGLQTFPGWVKKTPTAMSSALLDFIRVKVGIIWEDYFSFDAAWAANAYLNMIEGKRDSGGET